MTVEIFEFLTVEFFKFEFSNYIFERVMVYMTTHLFELRRDYLG